MIRTIEIKNFKSIDKVKIDLGRINVFIGENGAGKSNILEAIALAGAANAKKLDNEFLASRGIRETSAPLMRPQFEGFFDDSPIEVLFQDANGDSSFYKLENDNQPYSSWKYTVEHNHESESTYTERKIKEFLSADKANMEKLQAALDEFSVFIEEVKKNAPKKSKEKITFKIPQENLISKLLETTNNEYGARAKKLNEFVIYSPENTSLRLLEKEGQLEPLGICGEGLIKLLCVLSHIKSGEAITEINNCLKLLGWFDGFSIDNNAPAAPSAIEIHDRFLAKDKSLLDIRNANEGFLFLVFYFALFSTDLTPDFFAIDNIDASLNPKLCSELIRKLSTLAEKHQKQAILTTHNPAVLDGLNLADDEQRLFVISRNIEGHTKIKRIKKATNSDLKLSEMFMRGVIGGLPKGF
ncbi:AAA family ATPase [Pseudomonas lundensis]|uniref:AAA family ATPase n=1 Tax=Pseudomonas lundensis TaxID=86185 RepID=UPI00189117C9|nr:AAA family ATPase [Pseudomonas lundensis]QOF91884.1 AAA family ATPase [Pseudomonas lundensis]